MNMIDVLQRMAYDTKTKLLGKVDKVDGKALSSNDFSNAYKTKLDGIADGATANVGTITGIKMNGESKGTSGNVDLGTIITEHQDITGKQNKIDNSLTTTSKEIVGAINEVNSDLYDIFIHGMFKVDLQIGLNAIMLNGTVESNVIEGTVPMNNTYTIINVSHAHDGNNFSWNYHFDSNGYSLYIYTDAAQILEFSWFSVNNKYLEH